MQNSTAVERKSTGRGDTNEKTFRIPVSTGIFEHYQNMLDSIWLFLWYIDRTTKETDGVGFVLGGMPIIDSKPAETFGVPVKTIRRWRKMLVAGGYVTVRRTAYGCCVTLPKSKKWKWGPTLVSPQSSSSSTDLPTGEILTTKDSTHSGHSDLPSGAQRLPVPNTETARNGKYKEDKAVDLAVDSKKNSRHDAVRRRVDAELRCSSKRVFSSLEKRQKLIDRISGKIHKLGDLYSDYVDRCKKRGFECPFGKDEEEAFKALQYKPDLKSPLLSDDFVSAVVEVHDENREKGLSASILCSKVIDFCDRERKSNKTLGGDGGYYYPPDFGDHRDRLSETERVNQSSRSSV
jgi:hypothetical protein